MKHCLARLAAVAAFLPAAALCAEVQVMISAGFYGVYSELAPAFERASGHRLVTTRGPSMGDSPEAIPTRIARGESADVVIMDGHAAAVTANAREPAAAMALLRFLASSDVAPMLTKKGLAPPASQIRLLSAGAVATGMKAAVAAFEKESGNSVKATFNTAPQLAARLEAGELYDLVVAPPAAMQRFAAAGKVGAEQVPVGRVGMGVATRGDAPQPGLANMDTFQVALLEADSIVFNRASSGQYFEGWLKKRDLYERLEARITRYADAGAVMEHVLKGKGREFAVGPTTEIIDYRDKGLKLVGPLPAEIQNYTEYVASPGANASEAGRALLRFLGTPPAKAAFTAAGIE